jgi:hypothetical protein
MPLVRRLVAVGTVLVLAGAGLAVAQNAPPHPPMETHGAMPRASHPGMGTAMRIPTMPGQDAFGAIQQIVRILDADPKTDWSKIDLEALRQHLIDMNEVTLKADESPKTIEGGLQIAVTGSGRTLVAIQRMVPEWAKMANGLNGWTTKAETLENGELLTVTATTPKEVQHIRGLGFIGVLASGSWHQQHHLMMSQGEMMRMH